MTLDRWLEAATAGLPPEVAHRVRAEYTAHLAAAQEARVPEAEAVADLGDPERVRRALGRTYLGETRLQTPRDPPGRPLLTAMAWGMPPVFGLTVASIYVDTVPFPWWRLAAPALVFLLTAGVWWLTHRLSAERRNLWCGLWGGIGIQGMLWGQWVLQVWHGEEFVWPWFLPVFGLFVLGFLLWTAVEDVRLRHTLALEDGARDPGAPAE
ncbi:hypothetical protein GCM10008955_30940 [Deinococcus malanensis]|uniref:DUF1700 domain-containing protein n=1 Tax=Deinococcus malanensis TaxID=1706855 RepID=A0ABQ2F301_9DEIO|nr:hypothetical protein [Deinococcus malanensis]GGK34789.1 hypothetical protein GCM10008955_30940 [Deinococcus malanensis]